MKERHLLPLLAFDHFLLIILDMSAKDNKRIVMFTLQQREMIKLHDEKVLSRLFGVSRPGTYSELVPLKY